LASSSSEAGVQQRPRTPRLSPGRPWLLFRALALFGRAPAPYNPLLPASAPASFTQGVRRPDRAPLIALVPGDLSEKSLVPAARAGGVRAGRASRTRRLLLGGRARGVTLDPASTPRLEWPMLLRLAFGLWRAAEVPFELADLSLNAPIRVDCDPAHP